MDDFLAETGGIDGKPRGIHADWLRPVERLVEVVGAALEDRDSTTPGGVA